MAVRGGLRDRDSSLSIVTRLQTVDSAGFESCQVQKMYLFSKTLILTQLLNTKGAGIISGGWVWGSKRSGRDIDLSPPSSFEINP